MIRNQFHIVGPFLIQEYLEGTGILETCVHAVAVALLTSHNQCNISVVFVVDPLCYISKLDLNTAIIGNPPSNHVFLPVTEEDFSDIPPELPRILGFEAKWDENR